MPDIKVNELQKKPKVIEKKSGPELTEIIKTDELKIKEINAEPKVIPVNNSLLEDEVSQSVASDPDAFTSPILKSDEPIREIRDERIITDETSKKVSEDNDLLSENIRYSTPSPQNINQNRTVYRTMEDETTRINPTLTPSLNQRSQAFDDSFTSSELRSLRGESDDNAYKVADVSTREHVDRRTRHPWET